MDNLSTSLEGAEAPEISTQIDTGRPADASQAKPQPDADDAPKQPESRIDAIKRAAADIDKTAPEKPAKDDAGEADKPDKVEPGEKPKPDDDGGAAEDGADEKPAKREEPQDKARDHKHVEAPSKFLPKAKELWRNTPRPVQQEVERIVRDHEAEVAEVRQTAERYESIRQYDEMAQRNGRPLSESLAKITHVENMLAANPIAGLNAVLMEVGPRKADGQPYSLMEVAQFIVQQGPDGYQQIMRQANQQQAQAPQSDPRVEQLETRLAQMQHEQIAAQVIGPFRAENPRYEELQEDIVFFLNSGRIPASLSLADRLAAAYDMAERINPPSRVEERAAIDPVPAPDHRRADDSFSGTKSIKGAPASGVDTSSRRKRTMSRGDAIEAAMRELNIA